MCEPIYNVNNAFLFFPASSIDENMVSNWPGLPRSLSDDQDTFRVIPMACTLLQSKKKMRKNRRWDQCILHEWTQRGAYNYLVKELQLDGDNAILWADRFLSEIYFCNDVTFRISQCGSCADTTWDAPGRDLSVHNRICMRIRSPIRTYGIV